ncbi:hypothetical protein DFH07DRAFT_981234 [Mycena maculata]|uniref:Uncharacterized protein n=1 Tax=Mycena maculata TaxID=230809 RepID=A0AAD7IG56_9AGAR|nr:hypothetical protein DFH07DRAFT_981234 [Mycena maculata]
MPPTTITALAPDPPAVAGVSGMSAPPGHPPSESQSNWLPNLIVAANLITYSKDGAEAIPFPYVKAAFGMVVTLLETVQKVMENRDNLKEVCGSALEIIQHVNSAITFHGDAMAARFKDLCNEFLRFLKEIQQRVEKMNKKRSGFKGHLREILKADTMGSEILGYKERIRELRGNFFGLS